MIKKVTFIKTAHFFIFFLYFRVGFQFQLFSGIWPVNQEKLLFGVHLFHEDGSFLTISYLVKKKKKAKRGRNENGKTNSVCTSQNIVLRLLLNYPFNKPGPSTKI